MRFRRGEELRGSRFEACASKFVCRSLRVRAQVAYEQCGDGFEPYLIFNVESPRNRTVEIEYADQRIVQHQRYDQLRTRCGIAGDVTGEVVDIGDALRLSATCGCAAHALVEWNAHAGGQALEGTDDQFGAIEKIETGPVQIRQRVIDQRGQIRCVGDAIVFASEQRPGLRGELGVLFRLAAGERD